MAVIGTETTYCGIEHLEFYGSMARVAGVVRGDETYTTDDQIAAAGGVSTGDRVQVDPWSEVSAEYVQASRVEVRCFDLDCFDHLAPTP